MTLPTAKEINPSAALDGRVACKNFLGKNLVEAEALFRENSAYYQEDLMFMGPSAFRYYVPAVINYIQSDAAKADSDIINYFAGILKQRLEFEPEELSPIANLLAAACVYIVEHYGKFDAAPKFMETFADDFWH